MISPNQLQQIKLKICCGVFSYFKFFEDKVSDFASLSELEKKELWSILALRHSPGLGARTAKGIVDHFGSAYEAVNLGLKAPGIWVDEGLISERKARDFAREKWRKAAKNEWEQIQSKPYRFIFLNHPSYSSYLKNICDAPLLLYYLGDVSILKNPMISIVGSRRCSQDGIRVAAFFGRALSEAGVSIASGLALGIDRAAHIAGLSGIGSSVAVLGTGIDRVYPLSNKDVYRAMKDEGLILSEFPPSTPPKAQNFPIRNRIISAISQGTLIVEASKRSGSLITARLALEQNREVFVVPGQTLSAKSEGCRSLIRNGAKAVFDADDILLELAPLWKREMEKEIYSKEKNSSSNVKSKDMKFKDAELSTVEKEGEGEIHKVMPLNEPISRNGKNALPPLISFQKKPCQKDEQRGIVKNNTVKVQKPTANKESSSKPHEGLALSDSELELLKVFEGEPLHIDKIAEYLNLPIARVSGTLAILEVKGLVQQIPGMYYDLA